MPRSPRGHARARPGECWSAVAQSGFETSSLFQLVFQNDDAYAARGIDGGSDADQFAGGDFQLLTGKAAGAQGAIRRASPRARWKRSRADRLGGLADGLGRNVTPSTTGETRQPMVSALPPDVAEVRRSRTYDRTSPSHPGADTPDVTRSGGPDGGHSFLLINRCTASFVHPARQLRTRVVRHSTLPADQLRLAREPNAVLQISRCRISLTTATTRETLAA